MKPKEYRRVVRYNKWIGKYGINTELVPQGAWRKLISLQRKGIKIDLIEINPAMNEEERIKTGVMNTVAIATVLPPTRRKLETMYLFNTFIFIGVLYILFSTILSVHRTHDKNI